MRFFKSFRHHCQCPVQLQIEVTECGAVSLAMVMEYYGMVVPVEILRDECGVSRDGSRASHLLKVARQYGFDAQGFRELELSGLDNHPLPSILFWNFNHFVVYTGRRGKYWCINDPASGERLLSESEMDESFTGILLEIVPGKDFRKQGARPSLTASLWQYILPAWRSALILLLIGFLLIPGTVVTPNLNKIFIDHYLLDGYYNWGTPLLSLALLILLVTLALSWLQSRALVFMNLRMSVINSMDFLYRLFRLPTQFFTARHSGELANRIQFNDTVANFLSEQLAANLMNILSIFFFAFLLVTYDTVLGVAAILMAIWTALMLKLNLKRRRILGSSIQQTSGRLFGVGAHGIFLIETLKSASAEDDFFSSWSDLYAQSVRARQKLEASGILLDALPYCVQKFGVALIIGLGAFRMLSGTMSGGTFLVFQILLSYFFQPLEQLVNMGSVLQEIDAGTKRLDDVRNYPQEKTAATPTPAPDAPAFSGKLDGRVEIRHLTFGYNPVEEPLLCDFNLEIAAGERIAIVGASGSGKSTLAKLLAGFYRPWSGEILFDGRPREAYTAAELRYSFAMVDQEIVMFPGTVYDNLTMYDTSLPLNAVEEAARDARIHAAIIARQGGYFSMLHGSGTNFSGGERQRLEIARALTVDPSILVLDEATSALDAVTEVDIDRNIRKRGVTTIVVAHRLSTVRDADRIIVLDRGRIAESGTHETLMRQQGIYASLVGDRPLEGE